MMAADLRRLLFIIVGGNFRWMLAAYYVKTSGDSGSGISGFVG
jgi:hypothetical protein